MRIVPCVKRNGETDYIKVYHVNEYEIHDDNYRLIDKKGSKGKIMSSYVSTFATVDSETTSITHIDKDGKEVADYAFTYLWTICFNGDCLYSRTNEELMTFLRKIKPYYGLKNKQWFVIYIHNLSFEFAFLQGYIKDYTEVFAIDTRKVLAWRVKDLGIEFRDSLRQTNMNLYNATLKTPAVTHVKAKGDLDYKKIRHSQTPITDEEMGYAVNDVLGLWELETYKLESEGFTIANTPSTSTGYVRYDMRKSTDTPLMKQKRKELALDEQLYKLAKDAFRGGDTHANKYRAGSICENVYSFDASSMYPAMQCLRKFPQTKFTKLNVTGSYILRYLKNHKELAWLGRLRLYGVEMKDDNYNPYLSISKCSDLKHGDYDNDNGRIWSASELTVAVTDVDWDIIKECYDIESVEIVGDIYTSVYDYLPKEVINVIMEYFVAKTKLKELTKIYEVGSHELDEAEYDLLKAKGKLNAIYGMSATDPIRDEITFDGVDWVKKASEKIDYIEATKKGVLPYVWGVWTTAWARHHLRKIIKAAGDNYIYCDTDSCKALNFDWEMLEEINNENYRLSDELGIYVTKSNGKRVYMGYFDCESHLHSDTQKYMPEYARFKTLGSKKYAYDEYKSDGTTVFGITISGVRKAEGCKAIQCIENFKPNFKIKDSGGQNATYYDSSTITRGKVVDYTGKVGCYEYTGWVCLTHREYEIGLTSKQWMDYLGCKVDAIIE